MSGYEIRIGARRYPLTLRGYGAAYSYLYGKVLGFGAVQAFFSSVLMPGSPAYRACEEVRNEMANSLHG